MCHLEDFFPIQMVLRHPIERSTSTNFRTCQSKIKPNKNKSAAVVVCMRCMRTSFWNFKDSFVQALNAHTHIRSLHTFIIVINDRGWNLDGRPKMFSSL